MKKLLTILGVSLSIILIGCGQKDEKKEITVYSSFEEDYISSYISAFNKEYPDIKINLIRDSFGIIAAKFDAEKENPQADVLWGSSVTGIIKNENYLQPLDYDVANINKEFYDNKSNNPRWVGISNAMAIISYNTIEGKNLQIPSSYEDLLKKEYKGNIVMPNPASSGTGFYIVTSWIQLMGEKKAWEYMDELNKNIKMYVHSGSAPTKMASQGESIIGLGIGYESLKEEAKGAPIMTIFPKEGSGWEMEIVGLVKKAKIKPEAEIFAKWAISENAMKMYAQNRGIVTDSRVKPILEGYPKDVYKQLIDNNLLWAAENRDRILKEWESRYGKEK
ncbi:extracellular solute-binding protein [Cetobacterium sp.]|uniref:extracellular solute-binding protein n=1 Tax=Cetobacterium sp. TaxID=2071632 RepID=UPI002FC8B1DB